MTHEVNGVGPDATTDLEYVFAGPAAKISEGWYVRLDEIFSLLYLFKILGTPHRGGGMTDVAGPSVPIGLYILDGCHR
jgi:hypothetical protein